MLIAVIALLPRNGCTNSYLATPSIASYRMATSPSDQNNRNITAYKTVFVAQALQNELSNSNPDPKSQIILIQNQVMFVMQITDRRFLAGPKDDAVSLMRRFLSDSLPSLSNTKAKASGHNGDVASTDTLDDGNVVSWDVSFNSFNFLMHLFVGCCERDIFHARTCHQS